MSYTNAEGKNPDNVARGLKATLHNERVSDEAKESAAERLQAMGAGVPADYSDSVGRDENTQEGNTTAKVTLSPNQERGYKATLKNPNVSEEAKQHAQDVLENNASSH